MYGNLYFPTQMVPHKFDSMTRNNNKSSKALRGVLGSGNHIPMHDDPFIRRKEIKKGLELQSIGWMRGRCFEWKNARSISFVFGVKYVVDACLISDNLLPHPYRYHFSKYIHFIFGWLTRARSFARSSNADISAQKAKKLCQIAYAFRRSRALALFYQLWRVWPKYVAKARTRARTATA